MQVVVENLDRNRTPLREKIFKETILYLLNCLKIKPAQINVYFVDKRRIKKLNRIYLKRDYPTDVLCFNLSDNKKQILAEIFICLPIAKENARVYKNSFAGEVMLYIIHSILHILGYSDKNKRIKK